jgi:hypothetical protein
LFRPIIHITYPTAIAEWLNEREISIRMKVPSAGTIERFNLLAYEDNYRNNLIGNWMIELHSLSGLDLK